MPQESIAYVDIYGGRLEVGSRVQLLGSEGRGPQYVTELTLRGGEPCIEVNRRRCHAVAELELVAAPDPVAVRVAGQSSQPVLSGQLEVRLPWEGNRIYFAASPAEAIALLALKIGITSPEEETQRLTETVAANRCGELRFRGSFGVVGQLAYLSLGEPDRVPPRHSIGDLVQWQFSPTPRLVAGVYFCAHPQAPDTGWHYEFTVPWRQTRFTNIEAGADWQRGHFEGATSEKVTHILAETTLTPIAVAG